MTLMSKGERCWRNGERVNGDPFTVLEKLLRSRKGIRPEGVPLCYGGVVGYFGYECNHYIERLPRHSNDDLGIPDAYLMFFDETIVVDNFRDEILLIATGDDYSHCFFKIEQLHERLRTVHPRPERVGVTPVTTFLPEYHSNFTKAGFIDAVECAKEYISAGDTYQINLSQRLSVPVTRSPIEIYARLSAINDAHFASFF